MAKDNKLFTKPLSYQFILPSNQTVAFKMTNPFAGPPIPEMLSTSVTNTIPTGNHTAVPSVMK